MPKGQRNARGIRKVKVPTHEVVLIVPSKCKNYRRVLFIMDFVITGFGLNFFALALAMVFSGETVVLPHWTFIWLLVIGGTNVLLGVFSGHGAEVSRRKIERGQWNFWLLFVAFVFTILILFELFLGFWAFGESKLIENEILQDSTSFITDYVQTTIEKLAEAKPTAWWDWQKIGDCCGWQNNTIPDPLATGKWCTHHVETSAESCMDKLIGMLKTQYLILVGLGIFFVTEVMVCISSSCLACWIQAEEPCYY